MRSPLTKTFRASSQMAHVARARTEPDSDIAAGRQVLQRSLNLDSNNNMGATFRTLQLEGNASCLFGRSPHTAVMPTLIQSP